MRHFTKIAAAALFMGAAFTASLPATAETPKDTLVIAWSIDDIISLDPAEIFEFSAAEIAGNTYEKLVDYDPKDVSKVFGVLADSWTVTGDGKILTFKMKEGRKFASGNPVTAEDAVYTLERAVVLNKSPGFIITQFGFTPENVKEKIKTTGPMEFTFEMDKAYASSFVLYCLTASVGSIVDKKLLMEHEANGDFGYEWLKTHYAGSGPLTIKEWRANEAVVLERNENYSGTKTPLARVIYRHIKESTAQRLQLEKGDIDIARNLSPEELKAVSSNPDIAIQSAVKGTVYYLGLNQKNENLAKPEVREAIKYLVDYQAIADTIMNSLGKVHQAFLPEGFLGAINDNPYSFNPDKAKELLTKAGLPDGFSVKIDVRSIPTEQGIAEAIQQSMAKGGVKLEIIPGDGKQVLTKYRARQHDIFLGSWGSDYQDPNSNADTFAANHDNSDKAKAKPLAWRNAWDIPDLTKETESAVLESDAAKRAAIYEDLQKKVLATGPFVIMFQQIEVAASRKTVKGFTLGPSFDNNIAYTATKE
ncbi:ABC transporter substrate-binding protein [soil metagenome]